MPHTRSTKIAIGIAGTIISFAVFGIWFHLARTNANRSLDWPAVPAQVTSHSDARDYRGRVDRPTTTVVYAFNGKSYSVILDVYQLDEMEVYVNPEDPSEVRADRGATMVDLGYPLVGLVLSGLFALFLAMVCFSPKDED